MLILKWIWLVDVLNFVNRNNDYSLFNYNILFNYNKVGGFFVYINCVKLLVLNSDR